MPHTTKEERDSARGALGACDCFQCRLMMDFDELARASSGSTGAPPLAQPTPPELSRAVEALKMFADVSEDYENDGVCMTAKDARLLRESISAVLPHLLPHKPTFDDSSYAIPLERRLEAATIEFSHPRLGISPTNKHTTPLTTEEAKRLLALLKSAPLAQPTPPAPAGVSEEPPLNGAWSDDRLASASADEVMELCEQLAARVRMYGVRTQFAQWRRVRAEVVRRMSHPSPSVPLAQPTPEQPCK